MKVKIETLAPFLCRMARTVEPHVYGVRNLSHQSPAPIAWRWEECAMYR
jgi:hypothetical protein